MDFPRPASPVSPLTVQVNTSECSTPLKQSPSGLLMAYSTPIFYPQTNYYPRSTPLLSCIKQKPRVNFHSILDLVGDKSSDDSGFQSINESCSKTPIVSETQFNQRLYQEDEEENKENNSRQVQKTNNNDNGKKYRTTFSEEQKQALDVYFQKNPYPDPKETEELSQQLSLPENVIKVWFQNKRSRDKQRKFSTKSKKQQNLQQMEQSMTCSPLVSNLQMLQSRLNQLAAIKAAVQTSQYYSQFY